MSGHTVYSFDVGGKTVSISRLWSGGNADFEFWLSIDDDSPDYNSQAIRISRMIVAKLVDGFNKVATYDGAKDFEVYEVSQR